MNKQEIIDKTAQYARETLEGEGSGHDWWHIYRVWKMAQHIGQKEKADMFVVELAALLHDIADYKMHGGDDEIGARISRIWLEKQCVDEKNIVYVCEIVKELSFKGVKVGTKITTVEGMVVQDADRLDAVGAMGIARNFMTGAKFNEVMHDPKVVVPEYENKNEYIEAKGKKGRTVINHFYEKSLLLKDLMNTKTGKEIAQGRHMVMENFLKEFFDEWEGKA